MKKKRQIGFAYQNHEDDSDRDLPAITGSVKPDTDMIEEIIKSLYVPVIDIADADDFISTLDVCDAVTGNCDASKSEVFISMQQLGFSSESIEGTLYWIVKYK